VSWETGVASVARLSDGTVPFRGNIRRLAVSLWLLTSSAFNRCWEQRQQQIGRRRITSFDLMQNLSDIRHDTRPGSCGPDKILCGGRIAATFPLRCPAMTGPQFLPQEE
jgi:hypothetical protein